MSKTSLLLFLFSFFLFSACNNDWPSQEEIEKAQYLFMHGNRTKLRIPNSFMPSSTELLKIHAPLALEHELSKQTVEYNNVIIKMYDPDVDIFANPVDSFHHIIISDTNQRFMDEELRTRVQNRLHKNFVGMKNIFPNLKVNLLENEWKQAEGISYFKFKYKVVDQDNSESEFYNTVYLLTARKRSYVAVETALDKKDLEPYLLTMVELD